MKTKKELQNDLIENILNLLIEQEVTTHYAPFRKLIDKYENRIAGMPLTFAVTLAPDQMEEFKARYEESLTNKAISLSFNPTSFDPDTIPQLRNLKGLSSGADNTATSTITTDARMNELERKNAQMLECIQNFIGIFDTPIARRKIGGELADEVRRTAHFILRENEASEDESIQKLFQNGEITRAEAFRLEMDRLLGEDSGPIEFKPNTDRQDNTM